MRREEYSVNSTINAFKQEQDYAMHVLKIQKAKTVINTTPIEPPPHFKHQNDYNQRLRKDMLAQSEFILSLIPTKENPSPCPPKVRDFNEIFRFKKSAAKKSSRKTKNGNQESALPSQFFLTENQKQQYMTPSSNKRPINYYDFDKESYSPTGETILSLQSDDNDYDLNQTESSITKSQMKRQKVLSEKFNSRYYKPGRLTEETENSDDESSSANDDRDKTYRFQLNNVSNENLTGIEVDDNDFDYDLIIKSNQNKNQIKSTPKPKASKDSTHSLSSTEKKDDSISEAFASNQTSPFESDGRGRKSNQKYPISPTQQLAKLNQSKNSTKPAQSEKRMIRVKRKRIIRRRVPKTKNQQQEEEEDLLQKPLINYTYAKTTNGKPYQILFLKPGDPLPPNSVIIQMDTTRTVVARSNSPFEIIETDNSTSNLQMPMNSILIYPNQKNLMRKFIVKKTSVSSPTMSSFVVTSIDDKPLHFIYIQPDREVPPNSFLVNRDSRIRIAVQGQLKISQIKLGDPLPPNSIRVPSFINQPRRTVCIVSQDNEKLNFVTVRKGDEFQLPKHSIIVHSDNFTKTAVVSQSSKQLEYVSIPEGGKMPQNSIVLNSNVIKKKPPKLVVFPTKSTNSEEKKKEEEFLSFITVKNGDELPLNSIVAQSDDQNILALAPFDESQKLQTLLINEDEELPVGAIFIDLSQEKMIPNVSISSDEPLNVATFSNKNELPKDSVILKDDDKTTVALVPQQNQLLYATTKLNEDLEMSPNSFMIENCCTSENKPINRVSVISPDNQPLNVITLKSVSDLPQNSVILSIDKYDDNDNDYNNNIKSVVAAVAPNDQLLQMMNICNVDSSRFLSKLPRNAHYINFNDDELDDDENASNKIRLAVKSPDDKPLNVITVTSEDDIPLNAAIIRNDEKATIAVVSPNNQPLQLITLKNGENPPKNSYVLPKKDKKENDSQDPTKLNDIDHLSTENDIYNFQLAVTSNNEKPLQILTLNENEEIPHNAMIIQSGDFGNIVAVSQDGKEIRLVTVDKGKKIPSNCIEIACHLKNNERKANLCVCSPDKEPLQLITLKHGDELPENSFVIENDEEKIIAVTSNKPIQILSINEGEKIPKNAISIDPKDQKFAFISPNGEPLNIVTLKPNDEIPQNSKIIKKDDKTALAIVSPSNQPLLISTLDEGEEAPPNSFVFDPSKKDDQNELKVALFAPNKQQLNIITLKPGDELPDNSVLIKSDKESSIAISSPNSKPIRCVSLKKNEKVPPNSFVIDDIHSIFVPFVTNNQIENNEKFDTDQTDDLNDNDYNIDSEYESINNNNNNENKFDFFNDIAKNLTKSANSNDASNSNKNPPRLIVESNDKKPLKFFTLNEDDEIPENSMVVSKSPESGYYVCVASPNNEPLKFVSPDSFDKDRDNHVNAVDITQPNRFVVSSSDQKKLKIITMKKGEKLPPNSAIISEDEDRIVAVIGDPSLTVNCLKPDQNMEELPPNSIKPLIPSEKSDSNDKNDQSSASTEKGKPNSFKIAVTASQENPLFLVTLKPDDQIPLNSIPIENDSEKVIYAVSTTKDPLNCQIIQENDPIPENSIIAIDQNDEKKAKKCRIALFAQKFKKFHFLTVNKKDEIPKNSFIIQSDDNYKEVITSPTNSPLFFYALKDDEKPPENVFSSFLNNDTNNRPNSDEVYRNCAVSSYDDTPLCISMVKQGEKLPPNCAIIKRENDRVVALAPPTEFKPLLLHANTETVPSSAVYLSSFDRKSFAVSSKDGKQLSYTIVKSAGDNDSDGRFPKNSFIIDTEGGPNPRSLAVVAPEGQKLIYTPFNGDERPKNLKKNSVVFDRSESELANNSKIVVRGQDGKPLNYLTIGDGEELPENSIVLHEEVGGKKIVVQSSNKKPLQIMILSKDDEIPKNAIHVTDNGKKPIDRIVVMSSAHSPTNNNNNKEEGIENEDSELEPLQYVILKPNEEVPPNAAVIKREGGKHPRRLAVKSPTGHSLKYSIVREGEEIPKNSVTFCRQPSQIDSFNNNNGNGGYDDKNSTGVFNTTDKAVVAVTATDDEKPFQYIIAKFGDRLPKSMVGLFKEGGDDSRTVAVNSADESSSPLRFFFVNPGCELPANSVFLDEKEVRKSITVAPGPGGDPLLDFTEIGIDEEIPKNSIVVATIERDGKLYRVIARSSNNSPLVPSLVRPGFEARNALIFNRKSGSGNSDDIENDILEQIDQFNILKEKRARILAGQINSENPNDSTYSSTLTQTSLSAEAFVREALERFDLLLANGDDKQKAKRKKVMVKRRKKKDEPNAATEIEEEEEVDETNTNKPSQSSSKPSAFKTPSKPSHDRIFSNRTDPNAPPLTFAPTPGPSGGSTKTTSSSRSKTHNKNNTNNDSIELVIEEEEEASENTEETPASFKGKLIDQQNNPISPVSKQQEPITTLVMDRETLRRKFIESPVKIDDSMNSSNLSGISGDYTNEQLKKRMLIPMLNENKPNFFSARPKRGKIGLQKVDSTRSLKSTPKITHKIDTENEINDIDDSDEVDDENINITNNIIIDDDDDDDNINNDNESEGEADDGIDPNIRVSRKNFTCSSQFKDEMNESKYKYQGIAFSGMIDLIHIDKEIAPNSRQSERSQSSRPNLNSNTPQTPKTPKSAKPPPIPSSPNQSKLPDKSNSVRFV